MFISRRPIFWVSHSSSIHRTLSSQNVFDFNDRINFLFLRILVYRSIKITIISHNTQTIVDRIILSLFWFRFISSLILRICSNLMHELFSCTIWIYSSLMFSRVSSDKKGLLVLSLLLKFNSKFIGKGLIFLKVVRPFSLQKPPKFLIKSNVLIMDVSRTVRLQNDGGELGFSVDDYIGRLH